MLWDFSQFFDAEGAKLGKGPAEGLADLGVLVFNLIGETSYGNLSLQNLLFLSSTRQPVCCSLLLQRMH